MLTFIQPSNHISMNHWTHSWLASSCAALILGFSSLPVHAQSAPGKLGDGAIQLVFNTSKIKTQPAFIRGDGSVAPAKSRIVASVTLNNRSGTEQLLVFPSREAAVRKFTFTLLDSAGQAVALESLITLPRTLRTSGESPTVQRLGKSRRWSRTETLSLGDRDGQPLAPGKYTLVAALESDPKVSSSLPIEIREPSDVHRWEPKATARLMRKNDGSTEVQVTAWLFGVSALLRQTGAVTEGVTTVELSVRDELRPEAITSPSFFWEQARVTLPWAPGSQFVGLVFDNRAFKLVPQAPWKSGGPAPEDLPPGWP
jgi:hypothetical protein